MNIYRQHSFTLIELVIAVSIAIIAVGFALANYKRGLRRAHEKIAAQQLVVIREAMRLYRAHEGIYPNAATIDLSTTDKINDFFNISLIEDGASFSCVATATPDSFKCNASPTNSESWSLTAESSSLNGMPYCSAVVESDCTFCKSLANGGCPL